MWTIDFSLHLTAFQIPLHLNRFWKQALINFSAVLGSDFIADLVAVCDDILYQSIVQGEYGALMDRYTHLVTTDCCSCP